MKSFRLHIVLVFIALLSYGLPAQINNSLEFDGINDYVDITHNNIFNVTKVTIEMWMKWTHAGSADEVDFLISKGGEQLEIHTGGGSGANGLRFLPTTGVFFDTRINVFTTGEWTHIAFIYDPSIPLYKCYINGVEENLTKAGGGTIGAPIYQSVTSLKLGRRTDESYPYFYKGNIDEVRIWNDVRTIEEINTYRNSELEGTEEGLVAYYKMSDGSGSVLTDNSGRGNNGTLINGTLWSTGSDPLPVELTSFTARENGENIVLNWRTASEINSYGFEIERSSENSDNWQKIGFVPAHGNSNSIKEYSFTDAPGNINTSEGKIYYRLKQIDTDGNYKYYDVISVSEQITKNYKLYQNSPNPFNPETAIRFELPEQSLVTIKIYDITGREVEVLLNEEKPSGSHIIYWNGRDNSGRIAASGIYTYRFTAGQFVMNKKMSLVK